MALVLGPPGGWVTACPDPLDIFAKGLAEAHSFHVRGLDHAPVPHDGGRGSSRSTKEEAEKQWLHDWPQATERRNGSGLSSDPSSRPAIRSASISPAPGPWHQSCRSSAGVGTGQMCGFARPLPHTAPEVGRESRREKPGGVCWVCRA